jgi:hypothetical protein
MYINRTSISLEFFDYKEKLTVNQLVSNADTNNSIVYTYFDEINPFVTNHRRQIQNYIVKVHNRK